MGQLKIWAVNLGLALSSLVLGFVVGEIGLRVANIQGLKKLPEPGHAVFSPPFLPNPILIAVGRIDLGQRDGGNMKVNLMLKLIVMD